MKLENYLNEAKRGDKIYVIYSVSAKRVLSATLNPEKVVEILNNAGRSGYTNTNLARVEMRGEDDFGTGDKKIIVYKAVIL